MESTRSEEFDVYAFAPLLNFHTDAPEIKLSDGCVIGPPTDAEVQICSKPAIGWYPEGWPSPSFVVRTQIQKTVQTKVMLTDQPETYSYWPDDRSIGQVVDLRNAIRLFKHGAVGCGSTYMIRTETSKIAVESAADRIFPCSQSNAYSISMAEVPLFSAFYDKCRSFDFKKHPEIQIAMLRFTFSYVFGWLYQPIDLMIGFEALYLGEEQELSYKLAMRASYLLGDTPHRRLHIYRVLRKAYSIRSKLVHGEEEPDEVEIEKGKYVPLGEFLSEVEDILRESIKKFMELATKYSHKQLLGTVLDDNVINGGSILSGT